jgi:protein-S-isoprenylcysteine O-methyltransferase Ste14
MSVTMTRPLVALALFLVYLGIAFGLRTWQQLRTTGKTGFHGISGAPGTASWWGGVLFAVALVAGFVAPALELAGVIEPLVDAPTVVAILGAAVTIAGIVLTWSAQQAMGTSWRIGVLEAERTELVTTGLFAVVRNPIFSCMLLTAAGFVLLLPNALTLTSAVCLFLAIELQVRAVEEPYLLRTHGEAYAAYCGRVGRFVPGLGLRDAR